MRSAQRRAKIQKVKNGTKRSKIILKIFIPLIVVLSFFLFLKLTTKYWDGKSKVTFVYQNSSGDIETTVLDPQLNERTTLIVPGDTEINVAHGYGVLRIKNVWQLGINEKLSGRILAESVTNNFLFPTSLWSEQDIDNFWQFIFTNKLTNISFGDRISMALFAVRVKSIDNTEIDLGKNQFLKKQILTDGASGYVINGPISGRLTIYFSDNNFVDKNLRFKLVDETGGSRIGNGVGLVLEVLGGKVTSIDRKPANNDLDCVVYGNDDSAVRKVMDLFDCKKLATKSDFDLVMELGTKFAMRY